MTIIKTRKNLEKMDLDYEPVTKCLITGLPINGKIKSQITNSQDIYWYHVFVDDVLKSVSVCSSLYNALRSPSSEISQLVQKNKGLLIAELANSDSFAKYDFHANFCKIKEPDKDVKLEDFINSLVSSGKHPRSRKDKYDYLLNFLYKSQPVEGGEITVKNSVDFYGKLYFDSFESLQFFLREMQRKDLIMYDEVKSVVQFTFAGLEAMDTQNAAAQLNIPLSSNVQFDIGLSFAGENRSYVLKVAEKLRELGVTVFYDEYEQVNLWGKDLYRKPLTRTMKGICGCSVTFAAHPNTTVNGTDDQQSTRLPTYKSANA